MSSPWLRTTSGASRGVSDACWWLLLRPVEPLPAWICITPCVVGLLSTSHWVTLFSYEKSMDASCTAHGSPLQPALALFSNSPVHNGVRCGIPQAMSFSAHVQLLQVAMRGRTDGHASMHVAMTTLCTRVLSTLVQRQQIIGWGRSSQVHCNVTWVLQSNLRALEASTTRIPDHDLQVLAGCWLNFHPNVVNSTLSLGAQRSIERTG